MKSCLVDDSCRSNGRPKDPRRSRFEIEEAETVGAMDACLKRMPDAILLDWNMPVMSGIDFLRELRKAEGGQTPVVVFCTTENDIAHIQEAIGAGANEYIMKPFDSEIIDRVHPGRPHLTRMVALTHPRLRGPAADPFNAMVVDDSPSSAPC
jgi:two-component system chemotaxis response regulator CheY